MYCKNCHREIIDGATFCTYCGTHQNEVIQQEQQPVQQEWTQTTQQGQPNTTGGFDLSSTLLLAYIIISIMTSLIATIITKNVYGWYDGGWYIICQILWIISNLSLILVPLAIKNKTLKIIALVLSVPFILYWVIYHLTEIIRVL